MNKHLKNVVKRDKRKEQLISPICQLDAEIIWELTIVMGRLKGLDDIKLILESWKYIKDAEILDFLLSWNLAHPEGFNEKENIGRKFIEFEGELIELDLIKSINKDSHYNYATNEMEYRIVVNKDFPESFLLNNLYFSYPTVEAREERLKSLKRHLSKNIRIV